MADVPVPRSELSPVEAPAAAAERVAAERVAAERVAAERVAAGLPPSVLELVELLVAGGHGAFVVGGSIRDVLLGRTVHDWDLATDARPERVQALIPDAVYENRFGTV